MQLLLKYNEDVNFFFAIIKNVVRNDLLIKTKNESQKLFFSMLFCYILWRFSGVMVGNYYFGSTFFSKLCDGRKGTQIFGMILDIKQLY